MSIDAPCAPGLADPSHDAQRLFRGVLDAFSHPGRIVELSRCTGSVRARSARQPSPSC